MLFLRLWLVGCLSSLAVVCVVASFQEDSFIVRLRFLKGRHFSAADFTLNALIWFLYKRPKTEMSSEVLINSLLFVLFDIPKER